MTDREAMAMALEALETLMIERGSIYEKAITTLKERLTQPEQEPACPECKATVLYECVACSSKNYPPQRTEQEPVMVLPDGSAFGVMSFPLPDDHWLYAPNEYRDGEHEPIDLPKPVLTRPFRDAVVAAVRYAVRGATMRGQEKDFDPDALVQNAVYALCGPYTTPTKRTK